MKKEEFLNTLRKKLEMLENSEVEDIITEYRGYIEEKIESGVEEKEAVASFGDVEELANELLAAYKIKVKKEQDPIGDFAAKVMETINRIVDELSEKNSKEILQFIIEICVLLFLIGICRIPVSMLISLGKEVFYILSSPLNRIFFMVWKFVLEFSYFILSILVFIRIFEKRYLTKEIKKEKEEVVEETKKKGRPKKSIEERKEEPVFKEKTKTYYFGETIIKIGVFFLKFMAICILFGASFYLIGMAFVLGLCVYLLIQGITYFGFYLVMLALFLLGVIFFKLLFNFVIDKKTKGVSLFANIMISILLLGGGCGLAVFEVADTEFINSVPNDLKTETLTEELSMTKDTVFLGNIENYHVDNELEIVKVEYVYYPLGTKMSTKIRKRNDFVYLDWNLDSVLIKSDLLEHIINDLKEKKVYNYYIEPTITITANEKNIERIKKNRQKYYENETNYSSCEFVRTFTIEEFIESSYENEEVQVLVSEYLVKNRALVSLPVEIVEDLEIGESYEFTFKTFQAYIDTDIKNIFLENEVVSVKKTEKKGLEQRQDTSCKLY